MHGRGQIRYPMGPPSAHPRDPTPTAMPSPHLARLACLFLLLAVAAGAFGAHGLRRLLAPEQIAVWQTAVLYQFVHGLGMLALAVLDALRPSPWLRRASLLMAAGIVLFSGSLYLLSFLHAPWLGPLTPVGGTLFLAGWALAIQGLRPGPN